MYTVTIIHIPDVSMMLDWVDYISYGHVMHRKIYDVNQP